MKFHTDEHVPEAVALGLRRRGYDVTTTPQAGLLEVSDEEQLTHCRREERVMVCHDADMLRLAASGLPHNGIASQPAIQTRRTYPQIAFAGQPRSGGGDEEPHRISLKPTTSCFAEPEAKVQGKCHVAYQFMHNTVEAKCVDVWVQPDLIRSGDSHVK